MFHKSRQVGRAGVATYPKSWHRTGLLFSCSCFYEKNFLPNALAPPHFLQEAEHVSYPAEIEKGYSTAQLKIIRPDAAYGMTNKEKDRTVGKKKNFSLIGPNQITTSHGKYKKTRLKK